MINHLAATTQRVTVANDPTSAGYLHSECVLMDPEEADHHFKDNESFLKLKEGFQVINLFKFILSFLGICFLLNWIFALSFYCNKAVFPLLLRGNKAQKMEGKQSSSSTNTTLF